MSIPLDTDARAQEVTDTITHLALEGGFASVSIRAIARTMRLSPSTLLNHLGSRERILRVCGIRFARQRIDRLGVAATLRGFTALLPTTEAELALERVWIAWQGGLAVSEASRPMWDTDHQGPLPWDVDRAQAVLAAAVASARARSSATIASGSAAE